MGNRRPKPEWHPGQSVPEGFHEVRPHIRFNPSKAQPHWICFETRSFRFLKGLGRSGSHIWTTAKDYGSAQVFLKNTLKKEFKEEHERGDVDWLYVG